MLKRQIELYTAWQASQAADQRKHTASVREAIANRDAANGTTLQSLNERMQEANKALGQLASEGTDTSIMGSQAPLVGGAINAVSSGNRQMLNQAKLDFMTAVLRRESGAAISSGEYQNADRQYFPQVGDSEKVKAQKARNRELAINGILSEVPEKQRGSITPKPAGGGFKYLGSE